MLNKLFNKRLSQVAAIWFPQYAGTQWDMLMHRVANFNYIRRKYVDRYLLLVSKCGEHEAVLDVLAFSGIALSKQSDVGVLEVFFHCLDAFKAVVSKALKTESEKRDRNFIDYLLSVSVELYTLVAKLLPVNKLKEIDDLALALYPLSSQCYNLSNQLYKSRENSKNQDIGEGTEGNEKKRTRRKSEKWCCEAHDDDTNHDSDSGSYVGGFSSYSHTLASIQDVISLHVTQSSVNGESNTSSTATANNNIAMMLSTYLGKRSRGVFNNSMTTGGNNSKKSRGQQQHKQQNTAIDEKSMPQD